MWPFKKDKNADPLKTVDDIYAQVERKFNERLRALQQTELTLRQEVSTLQQKQGELVSKLRKQTDADILLLCKRIERDVLADKKIQPEQINLLNSLHAQQQQLAAQNTYGFGIGSGLLSVLGQSAGTGLRY